MLLVLIGEEPCDILFLSINFSQARRSGRLQGNAPETLDEDEMFRKIGIDRLDMLPTRRRRSRAMDPAALAALREQREADGLGKGLDSGLGVRFQGGRVYDSQLGVTCHWCRQKTLEEHVECTAEECGGGARLPTSFCRMCLRNRHGEDVTQAIASGCWVCPGCRGSCGVGCTICCNCGPCRKKAGLGPTHQLIKEARIAGFSNVHDYLVHRTTRESQEDIAARKSKFPWGKWLDVPYTEKNEEAEEEQELKNEKGAAAVGSGRAAHTPSPVETLASGGSGSADKSAGTDEDSGGVKEQTQQQQLPSPRDERAASRVARGTLTAAAVGKQQGRTPRSGRKTGSAVKA